MRSKLETCTHTHELILNVYKNKHDNEDFTHNMFLIAIKGSPLPYSLTYCTL